MRFEIGERPILQDLVRGRPHRKMPGLDAGLHRYGNDDEIDSARAQLLTEGGDRLHRIRLDGRGVSAMDQGFWFEERRAGDVVDVRTVKEPAVATEINLFVAGTELYETELHARQQPFG